MTIAALRAIEIGKHFGARAGGHLPVELRPGIAPAERCVLVIATGVASEPGVNLPGKPAGPKAQGRRALQHTVRS